MPTLLVSFDVADHATRHRLAGELMRAGEAWARPLADTWYVRTAETVEALRRRLGHMLDTDDGLLIQPVETEAILLNTTLRWFRQRRESSLPDGASNVVAFPVPAVLQPDDSDVTTAADRAVAVAEPMAAARFGSSRG